MSRLLPAILLVFGIGLGMWIQQRLQFNAAVPAQAAAVDPVPPSGQSSREILYWWDPMMPEYKSDRPGKSPMGMDMVPVYADEGGPDAGATVRIAPEIINNLGVRIEVVQQGQLENRIETGGFVDYDEARTTHVMAPVSGRVTRLAVTSTGQDVNAGDELFAIEDAAGATTSVKAPVAGVVASLERIYNGMSAAEGADLLTIVDPRVVWIKGEVFESDSAWLKVGQIAEARFHDRPGRVWKGSVEVISPKVEYSSRTVRYRMRFDNPEGFLVPNMFAEILLHADTDANVVHIPRQSLIRDGATTRVIVALGNGRFAPREVTVGNEIGERIEVRDGLEAGEKVVSAAQFLIDSEASLQQSLQRLQPAVTEPHQHNHPKG
jgi:membrane fusion protein, copper/silver efflux system